MKNFKYLHLMHNEKFIAPFIAFIKDHFNFEEHFFILVGGVSESTAKIPNETNVLYLDNSYNSEYNYFKLSKIFKQYTNKAEKIILHGLFTNNKLFFLYFNQNLLHKCYWVMWGADLYVYNKPRNRLRDRIRHIIRKSVYSKMGYFITYIKGDYELVQQWYGAKGKYHECFMYPSNLYKEYKIELKKDQTINIQIGNSADPTNNHLEVFKKLEKYKDKDIKIIIPLSYGDKTYVKEVIEQGRKIFGDKLEPLTEFMPFDKYLDLLAEIDIAIFNHNRQQAMGNIITLLGLGKKVYINQASVQWEFLKYHNIQIFSLNNMTLGNLGNEDKQLNINRIKQLFSKDRLLDDLNRIFNG